MFNLVGVAQRSVAFEDVVTFHISFDPKEAGVCGKSFGSRTPDTLQMSLFGPLQAACKSLKGSSPSGWGSSGTWPGWIPRKTTIVSSLPHYVHHLTGGDSPVVQEPLGWERLGRTYSHRISGFTRHEGRQRREILGIRSSVRQHSARSSPPRRRKGSCCNYRYRV